MTNLVTLCDVLNPSEMDNVAVIVATNPPQEYSRGILRKKISDLSNDLSLIGNMKHLYIQYIILNKNI
jgi:hypothetical protein